MSKKGTGTESFKPMGNASKIASEAKRQVKNANFMSATFYKI